jgi:hypothetical protein
LLTTYIPPHIEAAASPAIIPKVLTGEIIFTCSRLTN